MVQWIAEMWARLVGGERCAFCRTASRHPAWCWTQRTLSKAGR